MNISTRVRLALIACCLAAFASLSFGPSGAQVPSAPAMYNVTQPGLLITNTAAGAGTVNSADQTNLNWRGVRCSFYATAQGGTPSTTFGIQYKDSVSGQYQTYVVSAAITAVTTLTTIAVYPTPAPSVVPTGFVQASGQIGRVWRVTQTIGGTTPSVTGTIGCQYLL